MMLCSLILMMLGYTSCEPQDQRPYMNELFGRYYRADPDCGNRDRHIRYLDSLKLLDVRYGDDRRVYDQSIDIYIDRIQHYCVPK
jgi:hypothetical protein